MENTCIAMVSVDGVRARKCRGLLAAWCGVILVAAALLGGCSVRQAGADSLIYAIAAQPSTLIPLQAVDIVSRWAVELLYDGLVDINDRMEVVPALAERWDVSADGLVYTFHLRSDVRWHDGTLLTAEDVARTYRVLLDPTASVAVPRADYQAIAAVEAPDSGTVVLRLSAPDASLLSKLVLGIARETGGSQPARGPAMGTGPFMLREWQAGDRLVFDRHDAYFAGRPGLRTLTWQVVPDTAAQVLLLEDGGVDGALLTAATDAQRLMSRQVFRVYAVPGGNLQISLQLANPLFQDVRVRQALALALDRQSMVSGLVGGDGTLSAGDILPISWAYNPAAATVYPYDPAAARELLAQAGWQPGSDGILSKDGRRLSFVLLTDAGDRLRREVALMVRQQWAQVGVETELLFLERTTMVMERVLKGQFDAALLQSSVRADPDLSRRFHSRSISQGQNFLSYRNPALDALLDAALRQSGQAERAALYREAQMVLARDAPQINLFYPTAFLVMRSDVAGVNPSPMSPFWNVQDWRRP